MVYRKKLAECLKNNELQRRQAITEANDRNKAIQAFFKPNFNYPVFNPAFIQPVYGTTMNQLVYNPAINPPFYHQVSNNTGFIPVPVPANQSINIFFI